MLATIISDARARRGWSVTAFAQRVQLSTQMVRRLEAGIGSVPNVVAAFTALDLQLSKMPVASTIINQIVEQRKRRDLTISQVAKGTGLSRMTVRSIESGQGSMDSLDRLLHFLAPATIGKDPPQASWQRSVRRRGDDQFTPAEFLDNIRRIFGNVDLDPAWHEASNVDAKRTYSLAAGEDGLDLEWCADMVWLNPPYSQLLRWLRKADDEFSAGRAKTIVALVPVRSDSPFFHDRLSTIADIYLLRRRLKFTQLDGRPGNQSPFPLMIVLFGATSRQRVNLETQVQGLWVDRSRCG